MVSPLDKDSVAAAGMGPGQPEREVVGLASAADKKENAQRLRQHFLETEGIFHDIVMEIAGVGVEHRDLFLGGADDPRMTVPDVGNIVGCVQVNLTVFIKEVLPEAADDLEGSTVSDAQVWAQIPPPEAQDLLFFPRRFLRLVDGLGDVQDEVGVRAEAQPDLSLAGESHPGKIPPSSHKVGDHLEMEVRRPAAVLSPGANASDALSPLEYLALGKIFQAFTCPIGR